MVKRISSLQMAAAVLPVLLALCLFAPAAFADDGRAGLEAGTLRTTAAANTSSDKAKEVGFGNVVSENLVPEGSTDVETHWYKFKTDKSDEFGYAIALESLNTNQVKLTLYDSNLSKINTQYSRNKPSYYLAKTLHADSYYYVVVQWSSGNKNLGFRYNFSVNRKAINLKSANVSLEGYSYAYDGKSKKPAATVVLDGTTLVSGTDYTVSYSNNVNPGNATVTVTGKGDYVGSKTAQFSIGKAANTMKASGKKVTAKANAKKLKKSRTFSKSSAFNVSGAVGTVKFHKVSGNKKIAVGKSGKVTVKKGLKVGTYKVSVNVSADGNAHYAPLTKKVKLTVKVKR